MNKIVADILEHVRTHDPDVDMDFLLIVESESEDACEAPTHPKGLNGHIPEEPAAFFVSFPCGLIMMICAGWVHRTWSGQYGSVICTCKQKHLLEECIVVKIGT